MSVLNIKPVPHPLLSHVRTQNIPLWKIRLALGGTPSECKLSRMLRGIEVMEPELEQRLTVLLGEGKGNE
jgi:hypothetical protein